MPHHLWSEEETAQCCPLPPGPAAKARPRGPVLVKGSCCAETLTQGSHRLISAGRQNQGQIPLSALAVLLPDGTGGSQRPMCVAPMCRDRCSGLLPGRPRSVTCAGSAHSWFWSGGTHRPRGSLADEAHAAQGSQHITSESTDLHPQRHIHHKAGWMYAVWASGS